MLKVVSHKFGTVAIYIILFLNIPFAIKKRISVSALSSKQNYKALTLTLAYL
jgi:hypothetical protein